MIPARVIAIPFALLFGLGLYIAFENKQVAYGWLLPTATILVLIFVFSPQVNWWWWNRFPPDLHKGLRELLAQRLPYYQRLSANRQREFRRRLFLFGQAQNYMPQVIKEAPEDIKVMMAVAPVAYTMKQEDFLFPQFENVVLYPHPFPSPQYQEQFHASEIYEPDGVAMFCVDHVVRGFMEPKQYLNPAWYEYARIFRLAYPDERFAVLEAMSWEDLHEISRFSQEAIERWIGLTDIDTEALAVAYFFLFPERFQVHAPTVYQALTVIFDQDPVLV